MAPLLIIVTLLGLVAGSFFVPTPDEIRALFAQGQKFYAAEDYEQAIATYERINRVESPLLYTAQIAAAVGQIEAPIKEIALYQTGNSYFKRARDYQRSAARARNPEPEKEFGEKAAADFETAAGYFLRAEAEATSTALQDLARNRLITCLYESGEYERTIEEGRSFLEKYPESKFLVNVLYNIGWAYFAAERYEESIAAFKNLVRQFPEGYRAERALFQVAEAYFRRERYGEAVPWYQDVVDRQNIDQLSERDLLKMRREKMAGLVDETSLELAAKAQIKVGDCYARSGERERAVAAYRRVIATFAQEKRLVSEAYYRLADMYTKSGAREAAASTYREAIDGSKNRIFQAGMQSLLAEYYYGVGYYEQALFEYQLYLEAYGDVAAAAGLSRPWALYKVARAHYEIAEGARAAAHFDSAQVIYDRAIAVYGSIEEGYPTNELSGTATRFNIALCNQMKSELGVEGAMERALELYGVIVEEGIDRGYVRSALFQVARMHFQRRDFKPAIAAYTRILRDYPEDPQRHSARFELALCYRDLGETERTVELFEQIETDSGLVPKAMLEAANLLAATGEYRAALGALDRGLQAATSSEERTRLYYMKGRTQIEMEDFAAAVENLNQTLAIAADGEIRQGALYGRGVSLLKLKRYAEAAADLEELTRSASPELAASARRMVALIHLEMGREQEAIRDYRALVEAAAEPGERAAHLVVLAELHYSLRQLDEVEKICRELLVLNFVDERDEAPYFLKEKAYFLLGDVHSQREDLDALIATYREALARYPDSHYSGDMRFALGQALFDKEDIEGASGAMEDFLVAFPQHPNRSYALYYLGYALFNQTEFERAATAFAELAADYERSELVPDALFRAGEARYNLGQFAAAKEFYEELFAAHPHADLADDAGYNLAWTLLNLERDAEAIAAFGEVVDLFPNSPLAANAQFTVGDYYYNEERYAEALAAYEEVLRRFPESDVARRVPKLLDDLREIVAYIEYAEVEEVFAQALEKQQMELFRQAIAGFERIVQQYPGTESEIGALSNMGVCYESLREWKKAVEVYDRALNRFQGAEAEQAEAYRFVRMHKEWIETSRL